MAWHDPLLSGKTADSQLGQALRAVTEAVAAAVQLIGDVTAGDIDLARGWLPARDRELETVHVFAIGLANFTEAISRRTERDWARANGGPALPRLLATVCRLRALRNACDALGPLLRVAAVETDLASVVWYLDRTLSKLERVLDAAGGLGDGIRASEPTHALAAPTNH